MKVDFYVLIASLLFGASAGSWAQVLSPQGYGAVKFGGALSQLEARIGESANPRKREAGCAFVTFVRFPNIRFMVEDGIVTRADATRTVKNSAGVRIGMSLSEVLRRHPSI